MKSLYFLPIAYILILFSMIRVQLLIIIMDQTFVNKWLMRYWLHRLPLFFLQYFFETLVNALSRTFYVKNSMRRIDATIWQLFTKNFRRWFTSFNCLELSPIHGHHIQILEKLNSFFVIFIFTSLFLYQQWCGYQW